MKPEERRIAFLAGILTNAWNTLDHAIGLVHGESAELCDKETVKLVCDAFVAVEKAKEHVSMAMDMATDRDNPAMSRGPQESASPCIS